MYGIPEHCQPLSPAEEQVLLAVWACRSPATRRDIGEKLAAKGWAPATVLNFLYRLEKKGWVKSGKDQNRNTYTPTVTRRAYGVAAMRERLDTVFGGDLAEAVQEVFGRVGTQVIGTRHGEKLFETLMTREERLRAEDMGGYYRVACDSRDLNYDKFVVDGEVETQADESYTSHNTERLDVEVTIAKIKNAEYVQLALEGREHEAVQ